MILVGQFPMLETKVHSFSADLRSKQYEDTVTIGLNWTT